MPLSLTFLSRIAKQRERLVLSWDGEALAYVQAHPEKDGVHRVQQFGVLRQGADAVDQLARRLAGLGLQAAMATAMLRTTQYQILQIDAPAVPPEELRTAARWQIRELVNMHVDDLTLDVLKVGDDKVRATGSIFVVTAANAVIREVMQHAQAAHATVKVIDIQDLALRNLQSAQAQRLGNPERAHAAIMIANNSKALLTICANEELFYTRHIDLGDGFMQAAWDPQAQAAGSEAPLSLDGVGLDDQAQRLVVEIQRSFDLWDRTWPMLPLHRISVQAGERTQELADWLGRELGQPVIALDLAPMFPGFEGGSAADRQLCWPLLGVLLRSEGRRPSGH